LLSKYTVTDDIDNNQFNAELVGNVILKFKNHKSAGIDWLTAEHVKNSHPVVVSILCKLFELSLLSGYVTNQFGEGITIPIPKANLNKINIKSDDFRSITISPVISKIFEWYLEEKFSNYLTSSHLQFGF